MEAGLEASPSGKGKAIGIIAAIVICLLALWLTSLVSYLLFHSLVELFSVLVAVGIFIVAWNSRRFISHSFFLFLGVAFLAVGLIELLHLLAYKGMGVFPWATADLATQLWIAARDLEAVSWLLAPFFLTRQVKAFTLLSAFGLATALLLALIFGGWFPACFIEGQGLTSFKIISEYFICVLLVGTIIFVYRQRKYLDLIVLRLVIAALAASILSELSFTLYVDVYGLFNQVGHFLKITSWAFLYKAIIETGLQLPYRSLFRELAQSIADLKRMEEELRKSRDELEIRVQERTAELVLSNEELAREIAERLKVEQTLQESKNQLRILAAQLLSAQEKERKRIALEVHDVLGSSLSAIKFKAEEVLGRLPEEGTLYELISGPLATLIPLIKDTIEEARRIQADLRPPLLDDLGLVATFSWFCRRFKTIYSGIEIEQEITVQEEEIPDQLKIVFFRIAQEAMNNIVKHTHADSIYFIFQKGDGFIELRIQDNGEGFDPESLSSKKVSKKGLGLSSMKERIESSGGLFSIHSVKGKGTVIRAVWPFEQS